MGKKVAIGLAGQQGDIMEAMGVLKYKDELWGEDCRITWFAEERNFDLFAYQEIRLRIFPRGFGYPQMVEEENKKLVEAGRIPFWEDWQPLVDENNHLNLELAKVYSSLAEFDFGYFPAPHQMTPKKRHGLQYANVSKKVFGVPDIYEWHPVLKFSDEERYMADLFIKALPNKKTICLETMAGSGQSKLRHEQVIRAMEICRQVLEDCNFVFVSHKYLNGNEIFPMEITEMKDVFFASYFTVRQCALIVGLSNLLISVSSGITVAASCWENKNEHITPVLQYTGSLICSTEAIALGRFELVRTDGRPIEEAEADFEIKLTELLNEIK